MLNLRVQWMKQLSRRDFLKFKGTYLTGLYLSTRVKASPIYDFPETERLGRVVEPRVEVKTRPDAGSQTVNILMQDAVVPWYREVVGLHSNRINQRWVESVDGFLYAPALQPVQDIPNRPVESIPETSIGPGMWTEVTVPLVDVVLANPPARAPWLINSSNPRLYYSQILWVDEVYEDGEGRLLYRVNERYGFGDKLWADAAAFRPLTEDEISPLSAEEEDKRVVVNIQRQSLSCFEQGREVYFCRVSTGVKFDGEGNPSAEWSTPKGPHPVWRKLISLHMVGGTTGGGWDLAGVGWTSLFVGNGVAIHSTFWHNDFGVPRSRGCVNARPEDAKWIFRWLSPVVPYDPGDVTVTMPGGTIVEVVEA